MTTPTSLIADLLARLDVERRYEFEERAGTIEFDGQVPRDEAECLALIDLLRAHPGALIGASALQVRRDGRTQFVLATGGDEARDRFTATNACVLDTFDLARLLNEQFGGMAVLVRYE
jgi:hypothetical protein